MATKAEKKQRRDFALAMAIKQARYVYVEVMGTECYARITKREARLLVQYEIEGAWDWCHWGDGGILIHTQ